MKIAFIFPGYGSQYVGMGKELYDSSRLMQEYFEEASTCLPINFVKLCFASSDAELRMAANAYVSLFLVSISIASILKEKNVVPNLVAGFGIGEYAALHYANALSMPDGLYFLAKYAQFYQEFLATQPNFAVATVHKISLPLLKKICTEYSDVTIAVYGTDHEYTIVGKTESIEQLKKQIKQEKGTVHEMPADAGLYSETMQPVLEHLTDYLEKIDFNDAGIPCVMGIDGKSVVKGRMLRDRILKQIVSPIRWDKIVKSLADVDLIIEIGPGSTLSQSVRAVYPEKKIMTVNTPADVEAVVAFVHPMVDEQKIVESQ